MDYLRILAKGSLFTSAFISIILIISYFFGSEQALTSIKFIAILILLSYAIGLFIDGEKEKS